jgi:predicted amidohydrolase
VGLSICYDSWFPEVARHLAWMGAEVIISPTLTTTIDRAQELVLARAQSIANQVFFVSVNGAAPGGCGQSLVVDPEGVVRAQAGEAATVLTDVLDLGQVETVRRYGTSGLNRMWQQLSPEDSVIELPLYDGRIDPMTWGGLQR